MKKLVITGIATVAVAVGAFAQGSVNFGNSTLSTVALSVDSAANYFSGTYSIELWYLNGSSVPSGITGAANTDAYNMLTTAGFTLGKQFLNQTITAGNAGSFALGEVDMAGISPKGGSAVFAIAAWNTAGTWATMLNSGASARAGVVAFVNPTADYTAIPPGVPPDLTGWDATGQSLIMTTVPEPSTFALAGLGAAALLIFRRRK